MRKGRGGKIFAILLFIVIFFALIIFGVVMIGRQVISSQTDNIVAGSVAKFSDKSILV
ncbi:MAG: hypothetical protein ACTH9I_07925 [Lactococcus lactis]